MFIFSISMCWGAHLILDLSEEALLRARLLENKLNFYKQFITWSSSTYCSK